MKTINNLVRLLFVAAAITAPCGSSAQMPESVPENNYAALMANMRKNPKDTSSIRSWFEKNLKPSANPDAMFDKECLEFVSDVSDCTWSYDGSISKSQLKKKWGGRFDIGKMWDHAFENGNCGWASRRLAKCEYLGEVNQGDWFRLTIKGGCGENDFSETLTRVVKVVPKSGSYRITNLMNP